MEKLEFKGTKGKWKSRGYDTDSNGYIGIDFPKGSITIYGECTDSMNDEEKQKNIEEAEANAKLIASAPNMLQALQHIVEYWNRDRNDSAMHDALWHIIEIAEEAINKALK